MSILTRIFQPKRYEEQVEKRAAERTTDNVLSVLMNNRRAPPDRGLKEMLQSYNDVSKLRRVVHRIAHDVASVGWYAGYEEGKSKNAVYSRARCCQDLQSRKKAIQEMKNQGRFREVPEHPLIQLLYKGNKYLSGWDVRYLTEIYLSLTGEAFWLKEYKDKTIPDALWPVPPTWVQDVARPGHEFFEIQIPGGSRYHVESDLIIYFKESDPTNPYGRGSGIGTSLADEIDTDEYAAKFIKTIFYNSAIPAGIVQIKGANAAQTKEFQHRWNNDFRGHRRHGLLKFTGSDIDFQKVEQSFEELQMMDLRDAQKTDIREAFAIPPEIMGVLENSNRATIESAETFMAKFITSPRLERMLRVLQSTLVPEYDDRLVLYYDDPTPRNREAIREHAQAVPYTLTINQHLTEFLGMDDIGTDGDVRMVPINLVPMRNGKIESNDAVEMSMTGNVVMKQKTPDEIADEVVEAMKPDHIRAEIEPLWDTELEDWGIEVLQELGLDTRFNMLNPFIVQHLDEVVDGRIKDLINPATKEAVKATLQEGIQNGESTRELAKRITTVFTDGQLAVDAIRAERIARTEVMRTSNFGIYHAHSISGVVQKRRWVTAFVNSRDEHIDLHNTIVGIEEPFRYDGLEAFFPGAFGSGYMDINCGCVTVPVIEGVSGQSAFGAGATDTELEPYWKKVINDVEPWVQKARNAYSRGLWKQHDAAIRKLNEVSLRENL